MSVDKLRTTRQYDRRIKLSDQDKADIIARYKNGEGIRPIARAYEGICSRRLIQVCYLS